MTRSACVLVFACVLLGAALQVQSQGHAHPNGPLEARAADEQFDSPHALLEQQAPGGTSFYYKKWCNHEAQSLTYLDDAKCAKKFPSSFDRAWTSPMTTATQPDAKKGWILDTSDTSKIQVQSALITPLLGGVNMCVILIKRFNKQPYYKYVCGTGDSTNAVQPWSSTKVYALANAARNLRNQCGGKQGLTSSTTGQKGATQLGDLSTIVSSYDATAGYTSNGLSRYAHDIGGREKLLALLRSWWPATRATGAGLSLGGNYGAATPSDLKFKFGDCTIKPNPTPSTPLPNALTMLAHADMMRRMVLHSDVPAASRWPGLQSSDVQEILYGSASSKFFAGQQWGGMAADPSIYVQSALDMAKVDAAAKGKWRIFSKLGAGFSDSGSGQIVTAGYACLPEFNAAGAIVPDAGSEFIFVARASVPGDTSLSKADAKMHAAVNAVVKAIRANKL